MHIASANFRDETNENLWFFYFLISFPSHIQGSRFVVKPKGISSRFLTYPERSIKTLGLTKPEGVDLLRPTVDKSNTVHILFVKQPLMSVSDWGGRCDYCQYLYRYSEFCWVLDHVRLCLHLDRPWLDSRVQLWARKQHNPSMYLVHPVLFISPRVKYGWHVTVLGSSIQHLPSHSRHRRCRQLLCSSIVSI